MVFNAVLYSCDEVLQIVTHLNWDVIRVKAPFMGIADDRCFTVIGRNDDETVGEVEDIESGNAVICGIDECKLHIIGSRKL